jgi:hypothetical protein
MTTRRILACAPPLAAALLGCGAEQPRADTDSSASGGILVDTDTAEGTDGVPATTSSESSDGAPNESTASSDGGADESSTGDLDTTTGEVDVGTESSGSGTGDAIVPCDVAEVTLEPVPPNIMFVLDKSGSMISLWDHDADPNTATISRWNSLHQVVESVVTTFDAAANFGATLFPSAAATADINMACVTSAMSEVPVAPMNLAAILAGIPAADAAVLNGGTPATAGVILGRDHLSGLDPTSPRVLVLVSDGAANCSADAVAVEELLLYDDQLPEVVGAAWTDLGIPTYVVGIDASDIVTEIGISTIEALDEVAVAGGKPLAGPQQFYQTTNQTELEAALQEIVDDAVGCTLPLDPAPAFPELLEIYVDGVEVPPVAACDEDGWMFGEPLGSYDSIVLCGTWCTDLSIASSVSAEYYCHAGCPDPPSASSTPSSAM